MSLGRLPLFFQCSSCHVRKLRVGIVEGTLVEAVQHLLWQSRRGKTVFVVVGELCTVVGTTLLTSCTIVHQSFVEPTCWCWPHLLQESM